MKYLTWASLAVVLGLPLLMAVAYVLAHRHASPLELMAFLLAGVSVTGVFALSFLDGTS